MCWYQTHFWRQYFWTCFYLNCIFKISLLCYRQWYIIAFSLSEVSEVTQSCPTLCDPVDCSLQGASLHGILRARVLEWVAISFSRGSSRPRDQTRVSRIAGARDYCIFLSTWKLISCHQVRTVHYIQFSTVAQSCSTLCVPMNPSTPGLPVYHQLPEFTQTHVHQVSDAIIKVAKRPTRGTG